MCSLLTTGTAEGKASKMSLPPSLFRNGLQCGPGEKKEEVVLLAAYADLLLWHKKRHGIQEKPAIN